MNQVQLCTCGLVKQKPAIIGGVNTCTRCYKPIDMPVSAMRAAPGEVSGSQSRTSPRTPVDAARSAASTLKSAAMVIALLGAAGGIILVIAGLVPQCPAGLATCYSDEKSINIALISYGVVAALFWWWVYAISNAIAARVDLAAYEAGRR